MLQENHLSVVNSRQKKSFLDSLIYFVFESDWILTSDCQLVRMDIVTIDTVKRGKRFPMNPLANETGR